MTIPLACNYPEQNTYIFNTDSNVQSNGHGCCRGNNTIWNSFLSFNRGSCNHGSGNFWDALLTGGIFAVGGLILDKLFGGCAQLTPWGGMGSFIGGCDFTGGYGGWSGGFENVLMQGPMGGLLKNLEITRTATEKREKKLAEHKPIINKAIEASGIAIGAKSVRYYEILDKCVAIKTANPNITDTELQTRLENFTRARDHEVELTYYASGNKKEDLTVCDADETQETYEKLGKGYAELLDTNSDGKVEVEEFVKHEAQIAPANKKKEAEKAAITMFAVIDTNNDHKLDAKELAAYNYLSATCTDEEGTETAEDITEAEFEKWGEEAVSLVDNTDKQLEMEDKLKEIGKKFEM